MSMFSFGIRIDTRVVMVADRLDEIAPGSAVKAGIAGRRGERASRQVASWQKFL